MVSLKHNRISNWFSYKFKSYKYGYNYIEQWQERGSRLKQVHESSDHSKKAAELLTDYLVKIIGKRKNILEYGCSFGKNIKLLEEKLADDCKIYGMDVSGPAIEQGLEYIHGKAKIQINDGVTIPYPDNFFDLSFTAAVTESIPPNDFKKVCNELIRVTKEIIIHVEASRKYPTRYPHDYRKFYKSRGHLVSDSVNMDYDPEHVWYLITINPTRKREKT